MEAQLSFNLKNLGKNGKGTNKNLIYTTADATQNNLQFSISTNTLTHFTAGAVTPRKDAAKGKGSLIYLDLSTLKLSSSEFDALKVEIKVSKSGVTWATPKKYPETQEICLTPAKDGTLAADDDQVIISITNLAMAHPPDGSSVNLTALYYRISPFTIVQSLALTFPILVSLQNPPNVDDADLHDDIKFELIQDLVLTNNPTSSIKFSFSAAHKGREVKAGPNTLFTVNFVYAVDAEHGEGALTTTDIASTQMQMNPGTGAGSWGRTKGGGQENPSWALQPLKDTVIVGTGRHGVVEFSMDNISTDFPASPTAILVSWEKGAIPGYQGGTFYGLLEKVAHVKIKSLTANPNPALLDHTGHATVTVSWETESATGLTLNTPTPRIVTGESSAQVRLTQTTPISLIAQGQSVPGQDNRVLKTVRPVVLPVINSFEISPTKIYSKDFTDKTINLSWDVDAAPNSVKIVTSAGTKSPAASTEANWPLSIQRPELVTLTAGPGKSGIKRSVLVTAFTPRYDHYGLPSKANFAAASPSDAFLGATTSDGVVILDTLLFQQVGSTITVGSNPQGLAFSTDGKSILVANKGDGTVTVITVSGSAPDYAFTTKSVHVGGTPEQIAVTPDNSYAVVSVGNGDNAGSVALLKNSGGTYTLDGTITVGKQPCGIVVSPSGAQIFVANTGDNSISVLSQSISGYTAGTPINNWAAITGPAGIAVTPDEKILLVTCPGTGKVFALDVHYPNTTSPTSLDVGTSPQGVTVLSSGEYAFVSNQGSGSVSLLSCANGIQNCKVLEADIAIAGQPTGITSTPKGDMVLVAGNQLSVLTLAQYNPLPATKTMMAQFTPNGIAASSDKALIWSNQNITVSGISADARRGVYVYTGQSAELDYPPALQLGKYVGLVYVPGTESAWAIAATLEGELQMLDTTGGYATKFKINLPEYSHGNANYFARITISNDGQTLFVWAADSNNTNYSLLTYAVDTATHTLTLGDTVKLYTDSSWPLAFPCCASNDSQRFYAVDSFEGSLYVVEKTAGHYALRPGGAIKVAPNSTSIVISPDGSQLHILNGSGNTRSLSTVDTHTFHVTGPIDFMQTQIAANASDLAIMPDGSRLLVADSAIHGVRFIDPKSMRVVESIFIDSSLTGLTTIAMAPNASNIFVAGRVSNALGVVTEVMPTSV